MDATEEKPLSGVRSLWLVAAVLAGAALAWLLSPTIFRALPSDLTRTAVILDALNDPQQQPEIVSLGNSVVMAGVDMARLSDELSTHPRGLNLSSTGQAPLESYLYYQLLPDSVEVLLQFFDVTSVTTLNVLDEQKYNAFHMFGYRPDEVTRTRLTQLFDRRMGDILEKSDLQQRFESRWAIRQLADTIARQVLRPGLELDRSVYDLSHPNPYADKLDAASMAQALERAFLGNGIREPFLVAESKLALLQEMNRRARLRGIRLILVIQPVHPERRQYSADDYYLQVADTFAAFSKLNDVIVLNATDVLTADEFRDEVHPSRAGADTLSSWLAAEINALAEAGRIAL